MKKAVIYARFSCSNQTEQSIEGQLRVCYDYAKKNNIVVLKEYIDRAKSGTNDARPSFQLMMKECVHSDWDYVLVYKLDRFSRNKYESAKHKHTLKINNKKLISVTENIPETPEGIILESLLEGMNEYYSAELSQKVKRGLKESYLKGYFTGGQQLYGYDVVDKKLVINPLEASIVKKIYENYRLGISVTLIREELNKSGYTNKDGKPFSNKSLYRMLINPKYNGRYINNGITYDAIYPKIIDDATWDSVNNIHERNKHSNGDRYNVADYLLTGLAMCGHCCSPLIGGTSTSSTGKKYHYYSCRSIASTHKGCKNKSISKEFLENTAFNAILELIKNKKIIERITEELTKYSKTVKSSNPTLDMLESRKQSIQKSLDNMANAISMGIITETTKKSKQVKE